jgi:copper chaperone
MTDLVKQEFAVDGMTCQGCVRSVAGAVTRLAGVQHVDVSLANNAASVEYDATILAPAAILAAIEAAGFDARVR